MIFMLEVKKNTDKYNEFFLVFIMWSKVEILFVFIIILLLLFFMKNRLLSLIFLRLTFIVTK